MSRRKLKKKVKISFVLILIIIICLSVACNKFYKNKDKLLEKPLKKITTTTSKQVSDNTSEVNINMVGDFLFESPFYNAVNKGYDKNTYFSLVKDYFLNDDISVGNMEVVIGNDSLKVSGDGYNFCAPKYVGDLVKDLGMDVLSTANNHSYDRGIDGIKSTLDYFSNTNIITTGTYKSEEDRKENRILEKNGIKFGFIAYTLGTNIKVPDEYRNLIGIYRDKDTKTFNESMKNKMREEVSDLRSKVDVLIVMMHWGQEFTYTPTNEQKEIANFLNELGVDVIYGSHSHCIQPIEEIEKENKTLVFYSLGNFVSHDDDIARTQPGNETFDNSYQIGLLANFNVKKINDKISIENVNTTPIINYFDNNLNNFLLIPYKDYSASYETSHLRYSKGLTKEFITNTYNKVIDEKYHSN